MVHWQVPEPRATAEVELDDGTRVLLRRHGNPAGTRLVLSHGNGLAVDLYYPFWSLLTSRFDLVLYDFRNHGWNERGDIAEHSIATFVADNRAIARGIDRVFGPKPRVGVFHSMSATTALADDHPGSGFEALVLFDPPVYAPNADLIGAEARWGRQSRSARQRKRHFGTTAELADGVRNAPAFSRLLPGVPDLFAETTLRRKAGGGYELRCPPEYESRICEWALAYIVNPDPGDFACPVKVIRADAALRSPFGSSLDLDALDGLDCDYVSGATHFMQIEKPKECVALMVGFLQRLGLAP
ncbi:MAG: alpha/beta hydrolase [Gammaproteobacteria bacterium]|nr:alpha/beta hydrolase [Gammaproteobacteria bacterium]